MRAKKGMSDVWLWLILGVVTIILIVSLANPSKLTNLFKKIILRQNVENNIQPEDTIYLCSDDSNQYSCVISDMKKTTDCKIEVKKYDFGYKDDWITCENEACLHNNPNLLSQATVYFVPLHKEQDSLSDAIATANDRVRSYADTLQSCPGGTQIITYEVDDCAVIDNGFNKGIYCYDASIYSQVAKCVQNKYPLGKSFLIFTIDNSDFAKQAPKTPCNYDSADNLITSYAVVGQEFIIMAKSKIDTMNDNDWKNLLQNSKLLGKSCIPVSSNEPLSKLYPQCDQHLLDGQKI